MIKIVYSKNEVEINGNKNGLSEFMRLLKSSEKNLKTNFEILKDMTAKPYDNFIKKLIIKKNSGKLLISRENEILKIEGDQNFMNILADNIATLWDLTQSNSSYLHIEYFENHFYLHHDSVAIAISLSQ